MRTKNKIFRLTELQLEQLEAYLKKGSLHFSVKIVTIWTHP